MTSSLPVTSQYHVKKIWRCAIAKGQQRKALCLDHDSGQISNNESFIDEAGQLSAPLKEIKPAEISGRVRHADLHKVMGSDDIFKF